MRIEYGFELSEVQVPRLAVEAVEGMGKLFTLATLVLNLLDTRPCVELVFHGLNSNDPERKITAFRELLESSAHAPQFDYEVGEHGQVRGASSHYCWLTVRVRD